jgi:D-alanine transaminase
MQEEATGARTYPGWSAIGASGSEARGAGALTMPELAYINGEWMPISEARVSIDDRGFQFGDGVYEVIRSYGGRLWALDRHLKRLQASLAGIELTAISVPEIKATILEIFRRGGMPEASVYVQITRGVAPRRHSYDRQAEPTVVMTLRPQHAVDPALYQEGARCITVPEVRWARRDIKSTNLLGNILAKQRASECGAYEAIFVEGDGRITEGSSTNVFIVQRGRVVTRDKGPHILAGITRDLIVETARERGLKVAERPFTREDLLAADEVFLTGTGTEILGVVAVDDTPAGHSQIGPTTHALLAAFHERVREGKDE